MEIYNIGQDELNEYDLRDIKQESYRWIVYDYVNEGYDGNGEAVAYKEEDGMLYVKNLGHCSCYGPLDDWESNSTKVSVEDFFKDKEDIFEFDCKDTVKAKVKELLG